MYRAHSSNLWFIVVGTIALVTPLGGVRADAALEEILVTGEQPGPGLWKVTRPADEHGNVLWILGTHGPLPKKMTWRSADVEAAIAGSQEVLAPGSMRAKVGPLGGLTLLPSLTGMRHNPGGAKLRDVVPPDLYVRWLRLKARYLGRDDDVENWRPIFAARELYVKAIRKSGFESSGAIWPVVERIARKSKVPVTRPEVTVGLDKPRAAIKEFKRSQLSDLECFARTIERLESDLDFMRVRANAWARGDVAHLRELTYVDQASACIAALVNSPMMLERGLDDLPSRMAATWIGAAETALAKNSSTVAVLSIDQILKPDGYVAQLRDRGYAVQDP
jgi:hypothetical protein